MAEINHHHANIFADHPKISLLLMVIGNVWTIALNFNNLDIALAILVKVGQLASIGATLYVAFKTTKKKGGSK